MEESKSLLSLNESQSRYLIIDPGLQAAGWNLGDRTQVRLEMPVDGYDAVRFIIDNALSPMVALPICKLRSEPMAFMAERH
jgi:hypothetical protein